MTPVVPYCETPTTDPAAPCRVCGHAGMAHVGVEHCAVCELLDLVANLREASSAPPRHRNPPLGWPVSKERLAGFVHRVEDDLLTAADTGGTWHNDHAGS